MDDIIKLLSFNEQGNLHVDDLFQINKMLKIIYELLHPSKMMKSFRHTYIHKIDHTLIC